MHNHNRNLCKTPDNILTRTRRLFRIR